MIRVVAAKLRSYASFHKFVALHAAAVLLVAYVASRFTNVNVQGTALPLAALFDRPAAWRTVGALARWLYYVPAFFTVQLVCAELELKLVRAQVIAGLSRRAVVAGWALQSLALAAVGVAAAVAAVALFSHASPAGGSPGLGETLLPVLGLGLYGLAFLNTAVLAAVLLRRPVPALALLLLWPLVIEPSLGLALEHYGLDAWRPYLPFASFATLTPWPGPAAAFDPAAPTTVACIAYTAAAALASWERLRRLDL